MPAMADGAVEGSEAALLAQAAAAHKDGRRAAAAELLARVGPGLRHLPGYWALAAAVALAARARAAGAEEAALREVDARLAALLWQAGRQEEAVDLLLRVVAGVTETIEVPQTLVALQRLRAMLEARAQVVEAVLVQLRLALSLPEEPGAARDMGVLLLRAGAAGAARAWYRRALALRPGDAAIEAGLERAGAAAGGAGAVVDRLARPLEGMAGAPGDPVWPMAFARALLATRDALPGALARDAAVAALRRALALRPGHAEAAVQLALLLQERADADALAALGEAARLAPRDAAVQLALGGELLRQGRAEDAQRAFRAALAVQPDRREALLGLAEALLAAGSGLEALALADAVRALDPGLAPLAALSARALLAAGRFDGAEAGFRAVLAAAPDDAESRLGLARALLAQGRFAEAWPHHGWRWGVPGAAPARRVPGGAPVRPEPADWAGRRVLLFAEPGMGETIRFLRHARAVAAAGARGVLEVPAALQPLAAAIPDMEAVRAQGEPVGEFDRAVALGDLPWALGAAPEGVAASVPYLRADLAQAARFRRRLAGVPGLKVGLLWDGDPALEGAAMERSRALALEALAPLAQVRRAVFVSVQTGAAAAQAGSPPSGLVLHDWSADLVDLGAMAALMASLDVVIAVDAVPAQLAGALGRPVWLLHRHEPGWRWPAEGTASPWYPTVRVFRQAAPGDWAGVVARVAEALAERVGRR